MGHLDKGRPLQRAQGSVKRQEARDSVVLRTVSSCLLPLEHKPLGPRLHLRCPGLSLHGTEGGQSLRGRGQEAARGLGLSVHAKWGSLEEAVTERQEAFLSYVQF